MQAIPSLAIQMLWLISLVARMFVGRYSWEGHSGFREIDLICATAKAVLKGRVPSALRVTERSNPLSFYFIFVPFVTLPRAGEQVLWGPIRTLFLVAILRRRAFAVVLSIPVLVAFIHGQMGIFVLGIFPLEPASVALWNARDAEYSAFGRQLDEWGASLSQPVVTVDPPPFFNETSRRSIYLPTKTTDAIIQSARQFDVRHLV